MSRWWGAPACDGTNVDQGRQFGRRFAIGVLHSEIARALVPEGDGTRADLVHAGYGLPTPMGQPGHDVMGRGWPGVLARMTAVVVGNGRARLQEKAKQQDGKANPGRHRPRRFYVRP